MGRTKEEIEKKIIKLLDENSSKKGDPSQPGFEINFGTPCALGTSKNDIPRVTRIDFYNDGLTLWMSGEPGGKLENIRANPNVSVGIYTHVDRSKENRSVMLKGKASLVTYREQQELFMEVFTKFGILDFLKQVIRSGLIEKQPLIEIPLGEDFETKLDKMLHRFTVIKVEPEIISLLIYPPDHPPDGGIVEKLVWEKEG